MDYEKLAKLLFSDISNTPEYYEEKYPRRNLPKGAVVTRIGPSPTGFVHLGNLFNAVIAERLAHQSGGVFFLRIEDTDQKREVSGAVSTILNSMRFFGVRFDEGATEDGDTGSYGPYRQRQRREIYQAFAKDLVRKGLAYPCFCTEEQLEKMRDEQKGQKQNFGYYGEWALCRNLTYDEIEKRMQAGEPFVLRFKSSGSPENQVKVFDAIRGELVLQENYIDFVLLKSDGIPTYHFAHVVDDHLMRTTHVVRGAEWLATLPIHAQLFDTFGWERPIYCHTAQLMKLDGSSKRKLSKRKDPEFALSYYLSEGYLPETAWEYLLTILNSNFEEWRMKTPEKSYLEFPFSLKKMSSSDALFDIAKLNSISKEILSRKDTDFIYNHLLEWAKEYDRDFYEIISREKEKTLAAIAIGRNDKKPRKDIISWKQAKEFYSFFYEETFKYEDEFPENIDRETAKTILARYLETLNFNDTQEEWFPKVRKIAEDLGFAVQMKKYKENPELYKGSIADVSNVIRVAISGRRNSPDLWAISQILGEEAVRKRIQNFII